MPGQPIPFAPAHAHAPHIGLGPLRAGRPPHAAALPPLVPFDFAPHTRVVFGAGSLGQLGELTAPLGRRALVVTDRGLRDAGHVRRACELLRGAGVEVALYDDVQPNPTTDDVELGLEVARDARVDVFVGLGGGSSMDCAKGINFLLTGGGKVEDYWGVGKAKGPMLPMVAVPTTAGTGSEAQSFALIARAGDHMKMACGDRRAACAVALLDPELTVSCPPAVTAATGIDALSHAVESYVTKPRNAVSQLFSRQAWRLIAAGLPRVIDDPQDIEARGAMLLGAHFAGAAIEASMLGAAHALANPLSAHYGTTHGVAVGVMLPHVIRFNAPAVGPLYGDLAAEAALAEAADPRAASELARFVTGLLARSGQPTDLVACGVQAELLPTLAEEAAAQWTGHFNPRPVDATHLKELYRCALAPSPDLPTTRTA